MSLAIRGLYQARWSEEILGEVERNLARHIGAVTARERVDGLRTLLPEAMVIGYDRHLRELLNDPKDRHVVAAALEGEATLVITGNLKDFRPLPPGINAVLPDAFLCGFQDRSEVLIACLENIRAGWPQPPPLEQLLSRLDRYAPQFSHQLRRAR